MKKHNTMKVVLLVVTALWLISALFLPDKDWGVLVKCGLSLVELMLLLWNLKEKNNTLKVVLVTTFALSILAWILPAAYFSGEYIDQGRVQIGLFDLFNYSLTSLSYFGYIALFIVLVGGFYGILHKIPAYRTFLDKIVAICKGKEAVALSVMMVLLAVITSICGLQVGLILFFPMLASVILLMGYDKIVVALTLVGSTMVGVAGTLFAFNNTGILANALGLDMMDNILLKTIILLVGLGLLIFNTLMYAKRSKGSQVALKAAKTVVKSEEQVEKVVVKETKKTPAKKNSNKKNVSKVEEKTTAKKSTNKTVKKDAAKSASKAVKKTTKKSTSTTKGKSSSKSNRKDIKAAAKGDDVIVVKESLVNGSVDGFVPTVVNSKHKTWPIVVGFILMFVVMILAFIPWSDTFGLESFNEATTAVTEFELFKFAIFGKLLGTVNPFGMWSITDLFLLMAVVTALLTVIYKINVEDCLEGFKNGAKKALVPAILTLLVYTCLVITTYHPYQLAIYKAILGIGKGFNVVTTSFAGILAGFFNQDAAYVFQSIVPYFTGIVTNADVYPIAGILFQSIYGVTMLVAPTSLILVTVLSYLEVSYKDWLKAIWKLLVELLVVLLIVFTILVLV